MSKSTGIINQTEVELGEAPSIKSPPIRPPNSSSSQPRPNNLRKTIANKFTRNFHKFSDFPAEIRLLVWEFALPNGRVHELHPCTKLLENRKMMFRSNHSTPPTLLSTCHESREVALRHLELMDFEAPSGTKGIRKFYFNPRVDTIFLNTLMGLYMAFMLLESTVDTDHPHVRGVMKGWQNVALDADRTHLIDILAGHQGHPTTPRLKEVFPDLRKFTIAFDFTRKGKTRFRTSVWPGENGTTLRVLQGNTQRLRRLFEPIVQFTKIEYGPKEDENEEGDGRDVQEESLIPTVELANVKRKTFLRGDIRYGFRKTCALLRVTPPGFLMRL